MTLVKAGANPPWRALAAVFQLPWDETRKRTETGSPMSGGESVPLQGPARQVRERQRYVLMGG